MNADAYIMGRLAGYAIEQGARHGGLANMLAAAHVIRNRVEAGWHGGNWLRVLDGAAEAAGNDYAADPWRVDVQSLVTRKLLEKIDGVYGGEEPDVYSDGQALYFADLGCPTLRPWFVENIVREPEAHPRLGSVGPVQLFS